MQPNTFSRATVLMLTFITVACTTKPKYPACDGDKDCQASEHCVNKRCVQCGTDAHCDAGTTCIQGRCQVATASCNRNSDCPSGQMCQANQCTPCTTDQNGQCIRSKTCNQDTDCAEDEDCINGVCIKGGVATLSHTPSPQERPNRCNLSPIFFDFDMTTLRDDAKPILQQNAACLAQNSDAVTLYGYADPRGTEEYNIALSDQRGQTAAKYLHRLGVVASRLRIIPKGESEASGTDETGWEKDRRVEFALE